MQYAFSNNNIVPKWHDYGITLSAHDKLKPIKQMGEKALKKVWKILIAIAIILGIALAAESLGKSQREVETIVAEIGSISIRVEAQGEVKPVREYYAMSETGGKIKSVAVREGEFVSGYQELLRLENSEVEKAMAEVENAKEQVSEAAVLQAESLKKEAGLSKRQAALALAQSIGYELDEFNSVFMPEEVEEAEETMSAEYSGENYYSGASYDTGILRSGISGVVLKNMARIGEILAPGAPAMVIGDVSSYIIKAYIDEADAINVKEGMDVVISSASWQDTAWGGTVKKIGSMVTRLDDAVGGLNVVEIEVEPVASFTALPGKLVDVGIIYDGIDDVLIIPIECLASDGSVYVVNEGVLQQRTVRIGKQDEYGVEILSGIEEGEVVALYPSDFKDGEKVSIID
jgi:HlyD family secretion protein